MAQILHQREQAPLFSPEHKDLTDNWDSVAIYPKGLKVSSPIITFSYCRASPEVIV